MKPRSCILRVWIANDAGKQSCYSVRPLPPEALGAAAAGYRLCNLSADPMPVYAVCLFPDGLTSCDCPAHQRAKACKHADALTAAGILPCALIGFLQERTRLLDAAEAEARRLAEAAMEEQRIHEYDAEADRARIAELTAELAAVSGRAVQLQTALAAIPPAPPTRRRPAKLAAA